MSYTSLKKRFTAGSTVRVKNNLYPHLSGIYSIVKQKTNGIVTDNDVWTWWPKASEVRVWEPDTPGMGVPKIEFLSTSTGEVAYSFELLEEA